jgi:hypothetical protein
VLLPELAAAAGAEVAPGVTDADGEAPGLFETNGVDRTAKADPTMISATTIAPNLAKGERAMAHPSVFLYISGCKIYPCLRPQ